MMNFMMWIAVLCFVILFGYAILNKIEQEQERFLHLYSVLNEKLTNLSKKLDGKEKD